MRVTNNMILQNSAVNINGTKILVDAANNQMTTQKKISRPSEDPVTAIRSLRFSTSLSKINQYYEKNIPDAEKWLDVTETALVNMRKSITDYRTLLDQGANGTLTQDDRNTILTQLKSLQSSIYSEGNADYAGRTVFTGYRTDQSLTFESNETDTRYEVVQDFKAADAMEEARYYNNEMVVPKTTDQVNGTETVTPPDTTQLAKLGSGDYDTTKTTYNRIRLAYDGGEMNSVIIGDTKFTLRTQNTGTTDTGYTPATTNNRMATGAANPPAATATYSGYTLYSYDTEADWAAAQGGKKEVPANGIVYIKEKGDLIFDDTVQSKLKSDNADITVDYTKTGFQKGELRPEYYYNSQDQTDLNTKENWISYTKYETDADGNTKYDVNGKPIEKNYDIEYLIANNQPLAINLEAKDIFDSSIYQDIGDATDAVTRAINAHDKLTQIENMMGMEQYADATSQENLAKWKEAAQREADYYDDNLQKMFSSFLGKADDYLNDMNLAITKVGCKADQLELTEERMNNQQETVMELQSQNDDLDLSEIILKYTASYTAYQASLTAAGRLGDLSLLNYI